MISRQYDNFSQRLESSYDYEDRDPQFALLVEQLLRDHFGFLDTHEYTLEPDSQASPSEIFESIDGLLAELGSERRIRRFSDGLLQKQVALGNSWALEVSFRYRGRYDDDGGEDGPDSPQVRKLFVQLCAVGTETPARLARMLTDHGFLSPRASSSPTELTLYRASRADGFRRAVSVDPWKIPRLRFEDYAQNYTPEVASKIRELLNAERDERRGLVIIDGPPGTGKSYLIRMLASELKRRTIVCDPPSYFFEDARALRELTLDFRRSLIVLEDVGSFLTEDNVTKHMDASSTLLNYSDGILASSADTIFVLSFNTDIGRISGALTRPGRCLVRLHVGKLSYERAQPLIDFEVPRRDYTLAEVYEMRRTGEPLPEGRKGKTGF